jgi:NAD-dependent SIR2 family protein deacetylase
LVSEDDPPSIGGRIPFHQTMPFVEQAVEAAARVLARANALLISAGAGMGVDSGLPDFRGTHGFWRSYPAYEKLGLRFEELANPRWFAIDPELAWGFYGHRLALYRSTRPHGGFEVLRRLSARVPHGVFVFTSNVDGQFQRAGFDDALVEECHGAIDWLQCTRRCGTPLWRADDYEPIVDETTFRARGPLPTCPGCGALARPNVLMFGDWGWDSSRTDAQATRRAAWIESLERSDARLVVVECGAGTTIPTVRHFGEELAARFGGALVRVNLRESEGPRGTISIGETARAALAAIATRLPRA